MKYDPEKHHRGSIRLKGYDYSRNGAYFVTFCVNNRECLFGEIEDGVMKLNDAGRALESVWIDLPNHYSHIELGEHAIMPNHFHGIIILTGVDVGAGFVRAGLKPAPTPPTRHGLPEIVRALKTFSAREINKSRGVVGVRIWQRDYWEHIIRDNDEYARIAEYIIDNPKQWRVDKLNAGTGCVGAGFKPALRSTATPTELREPQSPYNEEAWMI